jgi:hypothetical protein
MKSSSLHELKKELALLPAKDLVDICVSLAKYKKDNKDFLNYLLVESYDTVGFVKEIKREIETEIDYLKSQSNLYYLKKSLRKLLRSITRYCRYINDKATSADLHIYFCLKLKESGIPFKKSQLLVNMYEQQLKKINSFIKSIHEDLQNDYAEDLKKISL